MNLIILTDSDKLDDTRYLLQDYRAEHIRTVLKLEAGGSFEIGLLNGPRGRAVIEKISAKDITVRVENLENIPPPELTVDLICALPRPQTLKKVLFTSAMMGVRSLHLIRANRVEKSYFQSPLLEPENYVPHLIEGLSQGKLTRLPEVVVHDRFKVFFEDTLPGLERNSDIKLVKLAADPEAKGDLGEIMDKKASWLLFAIGPEGGWVPFEIETMEKTGFRRFTLGRWLLRVEHAVTATLSQLELLYRESGG
ncbi:MAG: 16S rRNA (uracil(1498)-N(3))-methyltransferase [candidate division Zixibacteria bacterium]|nr:16S rRNA (uracil(1498)-N(3))-methyltransferase [candidate division Zixibacteria bacterium]